MSSRQVEVELLLLRLLPDGQLGHRWLRAPLADQVPPDHLAADLAGGCRGLCHSTSWRCEPDGLLVLTYAALPDQDTTVPAEPLSLPLVVVGGGALEPAPAEVDAANVAAHAVRHLADLAQRDPVVIDTAQRAPALWSAVAAYAAQARNAWRQQAS
jgi:hypothetical protein